MNELVYKLNLENITHYVKNDVLTHDDDHVKENTLLFRDCFSLFNNNLIHGIKFVSILYLKKDGTSGIIHKDGLNGADEFHFGINFNLIGKTLMKYWLPKNVEIIGNQTTDNDYNVRYPMYRALTEPDFVYTLEPESAYLINASIPHCGEAIGLKKTISIRTNIKEKNRLDLNDWDNVVKYFSNIII